LADPEKYENLFPGYKNAVQVEEYLKRTEPKIIPADDAPLIPLNIDRNPLEEMQKAESNSFNFDDDLKKELKKFLHKVMVQPIQLYKRIQYNILYIMKH